MKTLFKTSILLFATALTFSSCTNRLRVRGEVVSEKIDVANFSGVDLAFAADVSYNFGSTHSVIVNAQQNVIDKMDIKTENGIVQLKYKRRVRFVSGEDVSVVITSPTLTDASVSGSGSINVLGDFESSLLDLTISGSGDIDIQKAEVLSLTAIVSGSGDIAVFNGVIGNLNTSISGSGTINTVNAEATASHSVLNSVVVFVFQTVVFVVVVFLTSSVDLDTAQLVV